MSDKIKVYELAKNLGVTSVFLMDKIRREWKLPVKSHMEVLTPELADKVREKFQGSQNKKPIAVVRKTVKRSSKKSKTVKKKTLLSTDKKHPVLNKRIKDQKEEKKSQNILEKEVRPLKKIIRRKKSGPTGS